MGPGTSCPHPGSPWSRIAGNLELTAHMVRSPRQARSPNTKVARPALLGPVRSCSGVTCCGREELPLEASLPWRAARPEAAAQPRPALRTSVPAAWTRRIPRSSLCPLVLPVDVPGAPGETPPLPQGARSVVFLSLLRIQGVQRSRISARWESTRGPRPQPCHDLGCSSGSQAGVQRGEFGAVGQTVLEEVIRHIQ